MPTTCAGAMAAQTQAQLDEDSLMSLSSGNSSPFTWHCVSEKSSSGYLTTNGTTSPATTGMNTVSAQQLSPWEARLHPLQWCLQQHQNRHLLLPYVIILPSRLRRTQRLILLSRKPGSGIRGTESSKARRICTCLLYTSDAADE